MYTQYPSVQLKLNGRSLGPAIPVARHTASFPAVPYEPGTLMALAYDANGNVAATKTIKSASAASTIRLSADRSHIRADRGDLSYITAEVSYPSP